MALHGKPERDYLKLISNSTGTQVEFFVRSKLVFAPYILMLVLGYIILFRGIEENEAEEVGTVLTGNIGCHLTS
jgi:predicted permease